MRNVKFENTVEWTFYASKNKTENRRTQRKPLLKKAVQFFFNHI